MKYLFHYLTSNGQITETTNVHAPKTGVGAAAVARHSQTDALPSAIENYTVFLFVRNPYKRLVSGYLDKYRPSKYGNTFVESRWKHNTLTFSLFVSELEKRDWKMVEQGHFEEQTAARFQPEVFRAKELYAYDIERIDYAQIERSFGMAIPPEVRSFRGNHTRDIAESTVKEPIAPTVSVADWDMSSYYEKKVPVSCFYTPDLKRRVHAVYNADFYFAKLLGVDYEAERL